MAERLTEYIVHKCLSNLVQTLYACYRYRHGPEDDALSSCSVYLRERIDAFPALTKPYGCYFLGFCLSELFEIV